VTSERFGPSARGQQHVEGGRQMELRQLSYFVAMTEELLFGRAAAKVHIAKSALGNQMQSLQRELDP
jgi:hypothetical protein